MASAKTANKGFASALSMGMLVIVVAITSGCGPSEPAARMSGTVSFHNTPVPEGLLVLCNTRAGVYVTASIVDGAYSVTTSNRGVPPGEYQVAITPPLVDHPVGPILAPPRPAAYANIPPRYRDETTSGFTAQLADGDNVVDFDMTK